MMSLLFSMLSRFVIAFLPRSKWLQSPSAVILESKKIKSDTGPLFPRYLPWSDGTRRQDLYFLNVEFLNQFFHSPLSWCLDEGIKSLFSSSSLSAVRVVSFAYLRLLIFLPAILIPDWASSSPGFHMMYSAHKLNKQGDNIHVYVLLFQLGASLFHVRF